MMMSPPQGLGRAPTAPGSRFVEATPSIDDATLLVYSDGTGAAYTLAREAKTNLVVLEFAPTRTHSDSLGVGYTRSCGRVPPDRYAEVVALAQRACAATGEHVAQRVKGTGMLEVVPGAEHGGRVFLRRSSPLKAELEQLLGALVAA